MAERRRNSTNSAGNGRMMDDEPIMGNDMSADDMDDMDNDFAGTRQGSTVDPMDRVAQLYNFLRSPQVDTTIRRFVASRKTRQLIAAGMSILEIVVVLLPLLKKLGGRVNDAAALLRSQHAAGGRTGRGGSANRRARTGRSLPAHTPSGSSVN
ncbi:MAG TPA: hypothetical protein VFH43_08710 [Candidatus Kapabacteria bacterium]|nr:hypothetical protein [Candidatus Kapabacteria bacterium]